MTLHDRRRTDPAVTRAYTVPVVRKASQKQLVAWSLLRCPDDRHPRGLR